MVVNFSTYLRSHYQSFSTIYFGALEWNTDMYPLGLYILHKICFTMKHFNHRFKAKKKKTFQSPFSKGYDLTKLISYYYIHLFPGWCVSWIPQPIILSLFLYYMHWGINYERVKKNYKDRFSKRYIKSFGKNEKPYKINLLHHQTSDPSLHRQNRKK